MNIQQRVSQMAQKSKETKTKGREFTEEELKKQEYEEFTKDSLSQQETELVRKYLDKLTPLGGYQEHNVYEFIKKYDWNEKVLDGITNGMIKKKEEAGDFGGWTEVKRVEKAPPKVEKEQKGERKNKKYQRPEKTGEQDPNEVQGSRQQQNQPDEQKSFRRGPNQDRRRRDFQNQVEYQEGYYKERYYNPKGGRNYYGKDRSPGSGYIKKGGYEQVEYVKKAPQGETNQGQSEEQAQKQEENVIQPVEVTQSTQQEKNEPYEPQTSHSEQKVKRNEHNEEKRAPEPQQTELSAKKSQKEHEASQRPVGQQTPQKNKPHAEIPTETHQLKTPERPQETIKSQETNQTSGVKSETQQQNLPNVSSNQTQGPQPMFNPYMMPMMVPPNVKEMQPIFPFPYIVFPQPNGTCLIQPLYQMMPPMMPMSQAGFPGEQGKPLQAPNQGNVQKQGTYNPFEVPQQSNNPFFNFSNEDNKKGQASQPYPSMPFGFPNMPMGNYFAGQQQQTRPGENLHQSLFQK